MKKILLFLTVIVLTSCNKYVVTNIYERDYLSSDTQLLNNDIYSKLDYYHIDSIPIEQWISNTMTTDTTSLEQKSLIKKIDLKTYYQFILTNYIYPSYSYYEFIIRYRGKKYLYR